MGFPTDVRSLLLQYLPEGKAYQHQLAVELRSKYLAFGQEVSADGFVISDGGYVTSYVTTVNGKRTIIDFVLKLNVISIDISTQAFADVGSVNKVEDLVNFMMNSYKGFYERDFPGRTLVGIRNEIRDHYNLYYLYPDILDSLIELKDNFKVADIESSEFSGDHAFYRIYEPWFW